jgi:hypothetical protein
MHIRCIVLIMAAESWLPLNERDGVSDSEDDERRLVSVVECDDVVSPSIGVICMARLSAKQQSANKAHLLVP